MVLPINGNNFFSTLLKYSQHSREFYVYECINRIGKLCRQHNILTVVIYEANTCVYTLNITLNMYTAFHTKQAILPAQYWTIIYRTLWELACIVMLYP